MYRVVRKKQAPDFHTFIVNGVFRWGQLVMPPGAENLNKIFFPKHQNVSVHKKASGSGDPDPLVSLSEILNTPVTVITALYIYIYSSRKIK